MAWNVASFAFAVNGQQPDFVILFFEVVDNANASTFPFPCHCPTKLSHTTGTRNKFSRFRILEQEALEAEILIIGQVCVNVFGKSSCLNKFHNAIIRLCRTNRKGQESKIQKATGSNLQYSVCPASLCGVGPRRLMEKKLRLRVRSQQSTKK